MSCSSFFTAFRGRSSPWGRSDRQGIQNEISPRQGMIRLREFNMAELEYFIDPLDPPAGDLERNTDEVHDTRP